MIHPIFYYLGILFIIGGIGTIFVNRNKDSKDRNKNWLKYFIYLAITLFTIFSIQYNFINILSIIISFIGGIEIYNLISKKIVSLRVSIIIAIIYTAIALLFILSTNLFFKQQMLFGYLIVASFDGFSQICGQLFGKRKLISNISPGKTIEGLIGGSLIAILIAVMAKDWMDISILGAIIFALFIIIFAFAGDISASYIKRIHKVKDFGKIFPGHGGMLDRFDSLIVASAMVLLTIYISLLFF